MAPLALDQADLDRLSSLELRLDSIENEIKLLRSLVQENENYTRRCLRRARATQKDKAKKSGVFDRVVPSGA